MFGPPTLKVSPRNSELLFMLLSVVVLVGKYVRLILFSSAVSVCSMYSSAL